MTIETGLSDWHKMTITVLRSFIPKQAPICIKYRDFKKFNPSSFSGALNLRLNHANPHLRNYGEFKTIFMELFNTHAPMKERMVRANNAPFMTKTLSKAIMTRSRLRNIFLKNPNTINESKFKKQRNFCVNLLKRTKKAYFNNLDTKQIVDNKKVLENNKTFIFRQKC